jgi:hypothetical protein
VGGTAKALWARALSEAAPRHLPLQRQVRVDPSPVYLSPFSGVC